MILYSVDGLDSSSVIKPGYKTFSILSVMILYITVVTSRFLGRANSFSHRVIAERYCLASYLLTIVIVRLNIN